jgi:hypothetical protein
MTDTTISEIADDGTGQPIGTLEHLDPAILEIGDNVRDDAALSKAFIASIAENGVLVPITGVPTTPTTKPCAPLAIASWASSTAASAASSCITNTSPGHTATQPPLDHLRTWDV